MADEQQETKLFVRIDGVEHGPLTVAEVKNWIDSGKFRPFDFIRREDQKTWVKAENLVHLKALFDEAKKKATHNAFETWVEAVRTGKPAMVLSTEGRAQEQARIDGEQAKVAEERARLEAEEKALRDKLAKAVAEREAELARIEAEREEERRRLEAERDETVRRMATEREAERTRLIAEADAEVARARKEQEGELARLSSERERLESERKRLADEEKELAAMGRSIKARKRLPLVVAAIVVAAAILIGGPSWYFLIYRPHQELAKTQLRLADLDKRYGQLLADLAAATKAGDAAKIEAIKKEIEKVQAEKKQLEKETGKKPETLDTSRGRAKLAGLLRAEGDGASDPARGDGAISAGLGGHMGGVRSTYSRELSKNPGLAGHVVVSMRVAPDGSVTNAHVVSSNIGNSAVESACTSAARSSRFGPAPGEAVLTYKFDFSP